MSLSQPDFFVIYNRALNPKAETEDTKLSLKFTEELVQFLEDRGHKGHYADRDAKLGTNIFTELFKYVEITKKTIVVVTPGFLRNCWGIYSSQAAFKKLLDSEDSDKLIPIGIDISDNEKLVELNINEWIHFTKEWEMSRYPQKWNIISTIFDHDGPLSSQPAYQEYIHTQEHGDGKLRSDNEVLVVQPSSLQNNRKEFLSEVLLQRLGEKFPTDWQIFAIKLGLKDDKVKEIEMNNRWNVRMQAFNVLLSWRNSYVGSEQAKVENLLSVLFEMGRNDLAQPIEDQYKEFTQQEVSNPIASEGFDEVDMGMSRNRNRGRPLNLDQPLDREQAWSQTAVKQSQNTGNGEPHHTSYRARELKAEKAAVIEATPTPQPWHDSMSLDTFQLQQGPSMSLPSAPVVKLRSPEVKLPNPKVELPSAAAKLPELPSSQSQKLPNDNVKTSSIAETTVIMDNLKSQNSTNSSDSGIHGYNRGSDVSQTEKNSGDGGPNAMSYKPEVKERISVTNTPAQFSVQKGTIQTQQARNGSDSNTLHMTAKQQNKETEVKHTVRQSLSRDDDLTADVNGSFSFNQSMAQRDTSDNVKPKSLDINGKDQAVPSLNPNSLIAETTPDSGYSCSENGETPLDEQIIPYEILRLQTVQKNVSQSEKNNEHQSVEKSQLTKNQTGSNENISDNIESVKYDDENSNSEGEMTQEKSTQNLLPRQTLSTSVNTQNFKSAGNRDAQTGNNKPEDTRPRAELKPSLSSTQGQSASVGSRIFYGVLKMLAKPELAYS